LEAWIVLNKAKTIVKAVLSSAKQRRRVAEIKAGAPAITKVQILNDFTSLGLHPGDVVMLHSSLKSLGYVEGGPSALLEALFEAISPGGTLVVPTYYQPGGTILGTCKLKNYFFDPRHHGTNLGALPSAFLRFPGVERSIHPTHSVSAVGPSAKYITESHHEATSIFGHGSPWERCHELNAKILGLGVSMGPITFYHMLEDRVLDEFPLPVRQKETYRLRCKDWTGNDLLVSVTPLEPTFMSRRIDSPRRDDLRTYFWREFERAGLLTVGMVGQATSWYIPAQRLYAHLHALMKSGITIYSTPEELAARPIV
jgi:aminoglycoside N3'-acetyltransferase